MPFSSRIKFVYPEENKPNWYKNFESMVNSIDSVLYGSREDRNLIIKGGGTVTFNIALDVGTLTWSDAIEIFAPTTGFSCSIAADSIELNDGELFYVHLTRAPTTTVSLTTIKDTTLSTSTFPDDAYLVGYRDDTLVYFHGGYIIGDGESGPLFSSTTMGSSALSNDTPEPIQIGDTGDPGVGTSASRHDHVHAITSGAPSATGTANSEGASVNPARQDHVHKTNYTTKAAGATIGTRGAINFDGSNFSVADNGGADRVDVSFSSTPSFTSATLSGLTQGSVVFAGVGGLLSQDNSNLFFDDTNNRLGINTASPATSLSNGNTLITDDNGVGTLTTGLNWRLADVANGYVASFQNTNDGDFSHGVMIKIARNTNDIPGTNALYIQSGATSPTVFSQGVMVINRISTVDATGFCQTEMSNSADKIGFHAFGGSTSKGNPIRGTYVHNDATGINYNSSFTPFLFTYEKSLSLGTVSDNYDVVTFRKTSTRSGGSFTGTGSVVKIRNTLSGTVTDTTDVLSLLQDSASSGDLIEGVVGSTTVFRVDISGAVQTDTLTSINPTLAIGIQGNPKLNFNATQIEIQSNVTLQATGTGTINLPNNGSASFQIETTSVGTTVTAPNLDTLTDDSYADSLHRHNILVAEGVSGEVLNNGQLVSYDNAGGDPKVFLADATDTNELCNAVGFTRTTTTGADEAVEIIISGLMIVNAGFWDSAPVAADIGKRVYMSETPGNVTLDVSGFTAGSTILKVGVLIDDAGGDYTVSIQIGDGIVVP